MTDTPKTAEQILHECMAGWSLMKPETLAAERKLWEGTTRGEALEEFVHRRWQQTRATTENEAA